jgi:PBP1b-binding outer membrane lipoprotein LpoB
MKSILIIASIITLFVACNNADDSNTTRHDQPKTHADSLLKDVMGGHDIAMAKMDKLSAAEKQVHNALDSINKLPGKSKKTADYKIQLNALSEKLKYADSIMNKWMTEFNYDSATKGPNIAVYLESENQKITNVKEAMLSALQKKDSVFKK